VPGSSRTRLAVLALALLALFTAILWLVEREQLSPPPAPAVLSEVLPGGEHESERVAAENPQGETAVRASGFARATPEDSAHAPARSSAILHALSRDAQSGAAIPGMRLEFVEDVSAPAVARITYVRADREGLVEREGFPSGRWRITASATRYRPQPLGSFETLPEKRLELGCISLVPLPTHRGILRDENGQPVASQWITFPFEPRSGELIDPTVTNEKGQFELLGDLPTTVVLQVNPPEPLRSLKAQRFAVDRWDSDTLLELQLAAYQHVIVELYDSAAGDEEVQVDVCPDEGEGTESGRHTYPDNGGHVPLLRARELQPTPDASRFEFYAAAGKLQVWGGSRSTQIPPTRLVLVEGAADPEFAIRAR